MIDYERIFWVVVLAIFSAEVTTFAVVKLYTRWREDMERIRIRESTRKAAEKYRGIPRPEPLPQRQEEGVGYITEQEVLPEGFERVPLLCAMPDPKSPFPSAVRVLDNVGNVCYLVRSDSAPSGTCPLCRYEIPGPGNETAVMEKCPHCGGALDEIPPTGPASPN